MATTVPDGIITPDDTTQYNPPIDLAAMADTIQTALNNVRGESAARVGTDADRLAIPLGDLFAGLQFYATDTRIEWFYDGSNWVTNQNGMFLIQPASVAGSGVSIVNGRTVFTGASSVSANGVFSSRFQNYHIEIIVTGASVDVAPGIRLRAGGVDLSTGYDFQRVYNIAASTMGTSGLTGSTAWNVTSASGRRHKIALDLSDPGAAANTQATGLGFSSGGAAPQAVSTFGGVHTVVSACDGVTLLTGSGTFNGSMTVFGLA